MSGGRFAAMGTRELLAIALPVEDRAVVALAQACAADPRAPMLHALRSAAWMGDAATWANALAPALAELGPRIDDLSLRTATLAFSQGVGVLHDAVGEGDDLVRQAMIDLLPVLELFHVAAAPHLWPDPPPADRVADDERFRQELDIDFAAWRLANAPLPGADLSGIAPHAALATAVMLGTAIVRSALAYPGVDPASVDALVALCDGALGDVERWIDDAPVALRTAEATAADPAARAVLARARQTVGPLHHAVRVGFGPDEIAGLLLEAGDASVRLAAAGSPLAWRESASGRALWQSVLTELA